MGEFMIIYDRLWEYMKRMGVSQYKLINSGISHSTLTRLKRNQVVSVETIDKLCNILGCDIADVMEHVREE